MNEKDKYIKLISSMSDRYENKFDKLVKWLNT